MLKVGWGVAQKCLARWPEALGHTPSTKGDERKAGVGVTECIHGFSHTSGVWETEPRALLQVSTLLLSSILSGNNSWNNVQKQNEQIPVVFKNFSETESNRGSQTQES